MKDFSLIKFGAFSSDVRRHTKKESDLSCNLVILTKLFFMEINLLKKQEKKQCLVRLSYSQNCQPFSSVFLSQQISQQYFLSWLISQMTFSLVPCLP